MLLISEIQTVKERLCAFNQHYRPVIYLWEREQYKDRDKEVSREIKKGAYLLLSILFLLTLIKQGKLKGKIHRKRNCWLHGTGEGVRKHRCVFLYEKPSHTGNRLGWRKTMRKQKKERGERQTETTTETDTSESGGQKCTRKSKVRKTKTGLYHKSAQINRECAIDLSPIHQ